MGVLGWIMLVSGVLTCTMLYAAIAPRAALRSTFGETLEGPVAEIVVRNWGALIGLVGMMLIYGAFEPAAHSLVLTVAGLSKLVFVALMLTYGRRFLGGQAGVAFAVDAVWVLVFAGFLHRLARHVNVPRRTALVTGAAAGIGLATCAVLVRRGLRVIVTARTRERAVTAASGLIEHGGAAELVHAEALDVADPAGAHHCGRRLAESGMTIDVLVNNAALYPDKARAGQGVLDSPDTDWRALMEANFFGALWTCREFVPGMIERGYGRVVNVSSDYGSHGLGLEGPAPYSVSKAALNALTIKLAREVRAHPDVKVNALNPGWVRTKMGGPTATRTLEEGADTVVWLATLPADGPSGGFFKDRAPIPW